MSGKWKAVEQEEGSRKCLLLYVVMVEAHGLPVAEVHSKVLARAGQDEGLSLGRKTRSVLC